MEIEFKPKSKIGVIDYGVVNIGSLVNMLKKIGITPQLIKNPNDLEFIEKIILPGVGSFDQGIKGLREKGFIEALKFKALEQNAYILGICLGMQLLGHESEEGKLNGLGLIDGYCKKFKFDDNLLNLTVPHMGWNTTTFKEDTILFPRIFEENRFYFAHSYHFICEDTSSIDATTEYGIRFNSIINKGKIFGTQFHPEKSHKYGKELLRLFAEI